jgi:hypothetical protein
VYRTVRSLPLERQMAENRGFQQPISLYLEISS